MLRAAIMFFLLALLTFFFGLYGIAGISVQLGKYLLAFFLLMSVMSFVIALVAGKSSDEAE